MKKCVAAALVMICIALCGIGPVLADQGAAPPAPAQETLAVPAAAPPNTGSAKGDMDPLWVGAMSAVIPCTGQWYNGELMTWKTAGMAAIEAGSIFVFTFFLAGGGGDDARMVCMVGAGSMIANHAWSGIDAWHFAKKNQGLALNMVKDKVMVSYNVPF